MGLQVFVRESGAWSLPLLPRLVLSCSFCAGGHVSSDGLLLAFWALSGSSVGGYVLQWFTFGGLREIDCPVCAHLRSGGEVDPLETKSGNGQ